MWHIISTGWNCSQYLERCIESVLAQTSSDWRWHVLVDGGADTRECAEISRLHSRYSGLIGNRWQVNHAVGRNYAMANLVYLLDALKGKADVHDRVALLDLDDQLLPDALTTAEKHHNAGAWVTYGSYINEDGRPAKFSGAYPLHANVRTARWRGTHLRTFRYGLWCHVKRRDLRGPDGRWVRAAYDLGLMFPMLEMAGHSRCTCIPQPLYIYNNVNPLNDHRVRPAEQKRAERWIRRIAAYQRVEEL